SVVWDGSSAQPFECFIRQEAWRPVRTHHFVEPPGETAILEPFVGGRWFERWPDGCEYDWGKVLVWEPPRRIVVTWQVGAGWVYEPDPTPASEIGVRFLAESPPRTRVEFEHRHLERYAEQAERMRAVLDAPEAAAGVLRAYAARLGEAPVEATVSIS